MNQTQKLAYWRIPTIGNGRAGQINLQWQEIKQSLSVSEGGMGIEWEGAKGNFAGP